MIILKSKSEIEVMKECGKRLAKVLSELAELASPGRTTKQLDGIFARMLQKEGLKSAFKGYRGYEYNICASVNSEVIHGIPNDRKLVGGDILSLDVGAILDGFNTDMAITIPIGTTTTDASDLIQTTKEALTEAIKLCSPGFRVGDVSFTIEQYVKLAGYSVVEGYTGHGIGRTLHEDPKIPNQGIPNTGIELQEGMVIAIEPVVVAGNPETLVLNDCWTVVTRDDSLAAHFEHTVAITSEGPVVLTAVK